MRTSVYVDGFNLYHGCLKRSKFKWLNLLKLAEVLLPDHQIEMVKFFTARVSATPDDQISLTVK
jgi:hypothetical protein